MHQHDWSEGRVRRCIAISIAALGVSIALAGPLTAQGARTAADPDARAAAMKKLSFMVGEWSGDAWAVMGPGARHELRQTELIRYALNGQVLLIEGIGRDLVNGAPGDTTFNAVATIDWLPDRGYLMRSYTLTGQYGEFPVVVGDNSYSWTMEVPGGKVLYKMQVTPEGMFDERGWFVTAQGREVPTFGMSLRRVTKP